MIIYVNGPSSSGKSSIIKAVQFIYDKPIVNVSVDMFTKSIDNKFSWFGNKSNILHTFRQKQDKKWYITEVILGKHAWTFKKIMNEMILNFAKKWFDIIVDDVVKNDKDLQSIKKKLGKYGILFVKITCPLNILNEREMIRWDRAWWLARRQSEKMKKMNFPFDISIDTSNTDPFEGARGILQKTFSKKSKEKKKNT